MWTTSYSRTTAAGPEAVWSVLRDITSWGEWNAGIETIEVDGDPASSVAVGTTFRMTPPGEAALSSTVVELEPRQRLTDVTEVDGIVVRVEHLLEPTADGGTTITYRVVVDGPAPGEVLAEIGGGASADFPDVLAALAARAESGA